MADYTREQRRRVLALVNQTMFHMDLPSATGAARSVLVDSAPISREIDVPERAIRAVIRDEFQGTRLTRRRPSRVRRRV